MGPLFILAPIRTFTSVACAMIGCHPQMLGVAELNLFTADTIGQLRALHQATPRLQHGLLRSLAELAFASQDEAAIEAARSWLAENDAMTTIELFRTLEEWAGERRLVEKTPRHAYAPEALMRIVENFPDAVYIHLTRHPGDTVQSFLKLGTEVETKLGISGLSNFLSQQNADILGGSPGTDLANRMWLRPHLNILKVLEDVPLERQMRLRGEDLLSDPVRHLVKIADWLGIRSDAEAIEAMMHPEQSAFAAVGPRNARFGYDPNFMRDPKLRPYSFKPRPLDYRTPDGKVIELNESIRSCAATLGY